jgi:hypothetical protein
MVAKKGELTSQQIITIVILIISFVVILAFIFMLDIGGTIDEETCRNSLELKQINFIGRFMSLKCKTQDICFSMGGECQTYAKDIKKINVRNEGEILKETSNLITKCWVMMGEGKMDYGGKGSCAICYKVYFDEKIKTDENMKDGIKYLGIYSYMARNMPDQEFSYWHYLYQMNAIEGVRAKILSDTSDYLDINSAKIMPNEEYVIVTGQHSDAHFPPVLIKFGANELSQKLSCSKYVTEI